MNKKAAQSQIMKKKYVFEYKAGSGHYQADIFALRCFDNRFWKTFKRFMKFCGVGDIDPESPAGGAKVFASPEYKSDRGFFFREINKSIRLHHTKRIMLFTHTDCGAYGGLKRFGGNEEKEFVFHAREHKKARRAVLKKFPNFKVETYFIDWRGIIKTS